MAYVNDGRHMINTTNLLGMEIVFSNTSPRYYLYFYYDNREIAYGYDEPDDIQSFFNKVAKVCKSEGLYTIRISHNDERD